MKLKRGNLLIDPPGSASSDIAFILIIFFLVCASVQPEDGHNQILPRAEPETQQPDPSTNLEVSITPHGVLLNGNPLTDATFPDRISRELTHRNSGHDRVVILKSTPQTPYSRWIAISQIINDAGGMLTLEVTEEKTITTE